MRLRKQHLTNKQRSKRSEKRAAESVGGRVQPASGAMKVLSLKGDVKSEEFLVDDKTTNLKSFSINFKQWRKLVNEAWRNDRRPCMRIEHEYGTIYAIDELTFQQLIMEKV